VLILIVERGFYYAIPTWGAPGLKIGLYHHLGERGPAESLSREVTLADEQPLRECAEHYFRGAAGPTMALKTCFFTNTPDEHFIIDTLPGQPEVIVASPCSGHGFKFASVIGEILADLAVTGATKSNLSLFRLGRFAGAATAR
jgi:sarcosine oxidase